MFKISIHNETAALKAVVVGIADDFGGIPKLEDCYDPKSREHVVAGTFPSNDSCVKEMNALVSVFEKYDVKVCDRLLLPKKSIKTYKTAA